MMEDFRYMDYERPSSIFPDDYDKFEPPWTEGNPACVYIFFSVMYIDKIDDGNMEFSIQLYITEEWEDRRLNLSTFTEDTDEKPIFPTYLEAYLWQPDIVFDNTKDGKLFPLSIPNKVINVLKDGFFSKSSRYNLLVGCPMDFYFYPMDTQECYVKVSTLSSPDHKVLVKWMEEKPGKTKSIELVYPIRPLKYTLREPEVYKTKEKWTEGNYTYLYANFTFDRRLSASVFNVYVPSTLVVLLSWISFWVDIEAVPARVTLGVTSLLTLGTQVVHARAGLPAISYMTAMDVWLFACLISVFCALMEFAFSYQIFQKSKQRSAVDVLYETKKSPKTEIKFLRPRSRLAQNLALRNGNQSRISNKQPADVTQINGKYLDNICRKVFPFIFSSFALIYWIYYLYLK